MSDGILDNEQVIRQVAAQQGMGDDIRIFDLVGGCGSSGRLIGHLWRVFEPQSGQAFIICLADEIRVRDVESLGLDCETVFICRESALDGETVEYLMEYSNLSMV